MKKILLLGILVIPFLLQGQSQLGPKNDYEITFDLNTIVGSDTVLYVDNANKNMICYGGALLIEVNYTDLTADDATMNVGLSSWGMTFNTVSSTSFPYTLNSSGDAAAVNGAVTGKTASAYASKSWIISSFPGVYLAIKLTKGSIAASDYITIKITQSWD